jgi:hypothetical protein
MNPARSPGLIDRGVTRFERGSAVSTVIWHTMMSLDGFVAGPESAKYDAVAGIYGGAWTGPVVVPTHRPDEVPDDPTVTFLSDGIEDAVFDLRYRVRHPAD